MENTEIRKIDNALNARREAAQQRVESIKQIIQLQQLELDRAERELKEAQSSCQAWEEELASSL